MNRGAEMEKRGIFYKYYFKAESYTTELYSRARKLILTLYDKFLEVQILPQASMVENPETALISNRTGRNDIQSNLYIDEKQNFRARDMEDLHYYFKQVKNVKLSKENNEEMVEAIEYGLINPESLNSEKKSSMNVWISVLDQSLEGLTNGKLSLCLLESINFEVCGEKDIKISIKLIFLGFLRRG